MGIDTGTTRATGSRTVRGLLALVLFGGTALVVLHNWVGIGGASLDDITGGSLYDAVVISAGVACLLRARVVRAERWAWLLVGFGILNRLRLRLRGRADRRHVTSGRHLARLPARRHRDAAERLDSPRELMLPALFAALMIGLAGTQYLTGTSGLSTALWAVTMAAVVGRLTVSVRENRSLLEQVQMDPLTRLGNRGRMQVDLQRRCDLASEEHPVLLLFLDLNGFKHFNDSLGHPAGDELLILLGRALKEAVGEDGVAYRVGGDEFCVLLTCAEDRFDDVTRNAARALTAQGKGFAVSAAWGGAVIPMEAATPSEALQLADMRMYAQKESRRLAHHDEEGAEAVKVTEWPEPTSGAK